MTSESNPQQAHVRDTEKAWREGEGGLGARPKGRQRDREKEVSREGGREQEESEGARARE